MKTATQREQEFIAELTELLHKHGAELHICDDGKPYGMHMGVCTITMDAIYENEGPIVADFAEFNLPTWIG